MGAWIDELMKDGLIIHERRDGWMDRLIDRLSMGRMHACMDGQMDGWMNGWMDVLDKTRL